MKIKVENIIDSSKSFYENVIHSVGLTDDSIHRLRNASEKDLIDWRLLGGIHEAVDMVIRNLDKKIGIISD